MENTMKIVRRNETLYKLKKWKKTAKCIDISREYTVIQQCSACKIFIINLFFKKYINLTYDSLLPLFLIFKKVRNTDRLMELEHHHVGGLLDLRTLIWTSIWLAAQYPSIVKRAFNG